MIGRGASLLLMVTACLAAGRAASAGEESAPAAEAAFPRPDWFPPPLPRLAPAPDLPQLPGAGEKPWVVPLIVPLRPGDPVTAEGQAAWLDAGTETVALRNLRRQTDGPLGSFTAQVDWYEPHALRDEAVVASPWRTEQAWRLPVLGPLFLFGQFAANPDPVTVDALKMNGRTGVGFKVPVILGIELMLRGGPSVTYADPAMPDHGERSQLMLEVQCHCPLPGQLGLEYQTTAVPALTPLEHDRVTQDLGLAMPVGDGGKLRLGAKRQWEASTQTAKNPSWMDGMELYVGFELLQSHRQ